MATPFKTLDADCALHLADGTVFRFTTSATLTKAKDVDEVGLELGASAARALAALGGKIDAIAMKDLTDELAKARATIDKLTKKYEAARDPEPVPVSKARTTRTRTTPKFDKE